jgi:hypothetical protein
MLGRIHWLSLCRHFRAFTCLILGGLGTANRTPAAEPLWQLGSFDRSSAEFRPWIHPTSGERQIDYTDPQSDASYHIGTSDPSRDWPAYQPGSANGGAGFRRHPATLTFHLTQAPSQDLELRVALLAYSARLPLLQLDVNGRRGWFHQQPHLDYSGGDPAIFFQPHYAAGEIRCRLPAAWLITGTNQFVFTAMDVPGDREDVRPSGFPLPGCSGLVYDAISLSPVSKEALQQTVSGQASIQAHATPFFRKREGRLFAEIEVLVRHPTLPPRGRLTLSLGDYETSATFGAEQPRAFGEARVRVEVPAWEGTQEAHIQVTAESFTAESRQNLAAARRWQLWVIPHEHLDIGYTDYDAKVAELHCRVLDDAMSLSKSHPGFTFSADGFWVVEQYLAGRSAESVSRLVDAVRDGRIHIPAVHGSLFTGSASLEGLIRSLYPSRRFSREHGTPFDTAIITDVPSYAWSWASVLASAGIRYFVGASDAYRGPFLLRNRLHELGAHTWRGPDGGKVTTWYSRHYHQLSSLFGLPPRISLGRDSLPRFLQAYDKPGYRANDVLLYGTQVENGVLHPSQAAFVDVWNAEFAYPRLTFGGFREAMDTIVQQQGNLAEVRGDGGPYWEDGLAANARVTALARENNRRLVSAEKLASLAAHWNPSFKPDAADLQLAWNGIRLIDEHTWHADCSVRDPESEQARSQGASKDARTFETRRAVHRLLQRSLSAVADMVPVGPGSLLVFNPLSWARGGVVEVEIGRRQAVVDPETGEALPMEVLREGRVYQTIRFLCPEVPSLGYRSLTLRPIPIAPSPTAVHRGDVLDSPYFRAVLDPERGGLRSLVHRSSGRELIATNSPYALGQWIHVTGGDALPNRLVQFSTVSPIPELTLHPANRGRLLQAGFVGWAAMARMESSAPLCPRIETEILLPMLRPEARITVRVRKTATYAKEAAYVAFPWAIQEPRFRFGVQNGFIDPSRDILAGGCQEWFTVQDWVGLEGEGSSVLLATLDAPLITLGDIVRGTWPEAFGIRPSSMFSYVMSNYTPEGYAASQDGDFVFRYVVTHEGSFDAASAARWGAEQMNPLETVEITRNDKLAVANSSSGLGSLRDEGLRIRPDSVHLSTWKDAEFGKGLMLRLVETSGQPCEAVIEIRDTRIQRVTRCSSVEDDLAPLPVSDDGRSIRVRIAGFGIETIRVEPMGKP